MNQDALGVRLNNKRRGITEEAKSNPVLFAQNAKIYNEQPTRLGVCLK